MPPEPPSFYAKRNCYYGASSPSPRELAGRHEIGIERICSGAATTRTTRARSRTRARRSATRFHDKPEAEMRAILGENAARLYGFDLAKLEPLAAQYGPTPAGGRDAAPAGRDPEERAHQRVPLAALEGGRAGQGSGRSAILARSARRRRDDGPFAPFAATRLAHVLAHAARGPHAAAARRHRARWRSRPAPSGGTASSSRARPTGSALLALPDRSRSRDAERRSSTGRSRSSARGSTTGTIIQRGDLPPDVWEFLRRERFFGLIIPESYGGLGFSAQAHSAVRREAREPQRHRGRHGDGAELARAGGAAAPLRHRRAEATTTCRASRAARRSRASRSPGPRRAATPPRRESEGDRLPRQVGRPARCSACGCAGASATSRSRRSRR